MKTSKPSVTIEPCLILFVFVISAVVLTTLVQSMVAA